MSTNYIISCWSGLRRVNPQKYLDDRSIFIKIHIDKLRSLNHNLDQITVVINENNDTPPEFITYINNLPKKINHTNVVIMNRPNVGYSYGCYSDVFAKYKTYFDNYIVMEDDYIFMLDNFDSIMLNKMTDKCGFVSFWNAKGTKKEMLARTTKEALSATSGTKDREKLVEAIEKYFPDKFVFPRVAVGVMSSKMLNEVFTKFGKLPYANSTNHTQCKIEGQFGLSVVGQKFGWSVYDLIPEYGLTAFGPNGEITEHNPNNKPIFISAIQSML
jgi:hypothetical protein